MCMHAVSVQPGHERKWGARQRPPQQAVNESTTSVVGQILGPKFGRKCVLRPIKIVYQKEFFSHAPSPITMAEPLLHTEESTTTTFAHSLHVLGTRDGRTTNNCH